MTSVHILAIDLAKRSFQVCATDRGGAVLFNRVLSRARLQQLLNEQPPGIHTRRVCRRPQLVRSRVYDKQDDEQILS